MRVYIMTDLEGISGIFDIAYMDTKSDYYRSARSLLVGDTNAAIAGCFDAGANEVVVNDGHFRGNNFVTQELDPRAKLDKARNPWTGILDESFDASLFVGVHAKAGTQNAFLDHTMSPESWFDYSINGRSVGEIGMWATMAGHLKVPLVYVCGDRAACAEAQALVPGLVATPVKTGLGRNQAYGLHPEEAHAQIRRDVTKSLAARPLPKPLVWKKPVTVKLVVNRSDMADGGGRGVKRADARTLVKKVDDQFDIMM
jgi:D-amino peptidase